MLYAFVYCKYISKASKFCGNRIYRLIVDDSKVSEKFTCAFFDKFFLTLFTFFIDFPNQLCSSVPEIVLNGILN